MKKYLFILLLSSCFFTFKGKAQDVYRTLGGQMLITAVANDSVLKITNKELLIQFNYETSRFIIKMDKSDFKTGIDSLDAKLAQLKYDIIEYKGKFGVDNINADDHPPLDFTVEGVLSTNDHIIKGKGHLEHISSRGTFSCLLTLKFNLTLEELGINLNGLSIEDEVQIEIVQSILNKYDNQ